MRHLFVYGSLLFGEQNHHEMRGARLVRTTSTAPAFTLFDLGPYPALVAGGTTAVEGELYAVNTALLARLDRFEQHPHVYRRGPIALADGSEVEADVEAYFFVDEARARACPPIGASFRKGRSPLRGD